MNEERDPSGLRPARFRRFQDRRINLSPGRRNLTRSLRCDKEDSLGFTQFRILDTGILL